ncbi:MAG: TA system VapC family ribonuclease toxin [Gemmataceae bacterium]
MPACLVDTNIWVALAFEAHPAHDLAAESFAQLTSAEPALFCRSTEQSFLRLATTPRMLKHYGADAVTNEQALDTLRHFQSHPAVAFRPEPAGLVPVWHRLAGLSSASPKVWMDAYLAAFAITGGLRMLTLDGDFKSFVPEGLDLLLLELP